MKLNMKFKTQHTRSGKESGILILHGIVRTSHIQLFSKDCNSRKPIIQIHITELNEVEFDLRLWIIRMAKYLCGKGELRFGSPCR
jgi:hypothetical protein